MAKRYEVERKFRLADSAKTEAMLMALAGNPVSDEQQADMYYAHPARDFAATDEALRVRRVGHHNALTYKGPKIDLQTKTREEIEVDFEEGGIAAEKLGSLLEALGFRPVAEVKKRRQQWHLTEGGTEVIVALDLVDRLGGFLELEIQADESEVNRAKSCLADLAERLGVAQDERRSYLELLLEG